MVYDGLLVVAVWMVGTAALLPFTGGEAVGPGESWYGIYLLILAFAYFGWFWVHGGQTLGMRSWRLRLKAADGTRVRWGQALVRFLGACLSWLPLGLGFLWALADPRRRTWHDRLSSTVIVDGS